MYKKIIAVIMSVCMLVPVSVNAEESSVIYGDANCDTKVDIRDIASLKSHLVGLKELSAKGLESCGFFNNTVSVKSLGQLIKYIIKEVDKLQFSYYDDGIYDEDYVYKPTETTRDFEDNKVLVVIKHQNSKPNKVWTADDFNVDNISSIEDLSSFDDWSDEEIAEYMVKHSRTFKQILCIYLEDTGKDKVIKMLEDLSKNNTGVIYMSSFSTIYENEA